MVKLTNAVDEALVRRGMLTPEQVRTYEADALVDTGAVRMVIPPQVATRLGLGVRGQRVAEYADGRTESVSVTEPLVVEIDGRDTLEEALILGDEILIGQTVLEKLDLFVDSRRRRLVPNPAVVESGYTNIDLREGRAEQLPAGDGSFDVLLASLSLMYVIDRAAAAREMRRVLRPGGRFVAAVWAAAERCDIVLFQQTAGRFAPPPPVPGVGPGALADPTAFLAQLADVGIDVRVETEELGFDFLDFELAWEVLAGVTTAQLPAKRRQEAKEAVQAVMWPHGRGPRHFRNVTQFLVGRVAG